MRVRSGHSTNTVNLVTSKEPQQSEMRRHGKNPLRQRGQTDRPAGTPQHLGHAEVATQIVPIEIACLESGAEVHPMDLHLPPAKQWKQPHRPRTRQRSCHSRPDRLRIRRFERRCPCGCQLSRRLINIVNQISHISTGTRFDLTIPRCGIVILGTAAEHLKVAIGVAGEMGQHMANSPTGKAAERSRVEVISAAQIFDETSLRGDAAVDLRFECTPVEPHRVSLADRSEPIAARNDDHRAVGLVVHRHPHPVELSQRLG